MKQLGLENLGSQTYRVYELETDEALDMVDFGMITNNTIPGFAKTIFTQMDEQRCLKYDVTGKITAAALLEEKIGRRRLLGILRGIASAAVQAEAYMLDPGNVQTGLDDIFVNVSKDEVSLICLPVQREEKPQAALAQVVRKIMMSAQFEPQEDCGYVAQILNFLNRNASFTPEAFLKFLDTMTGKEPVKAAAPEPVPAPVSAPVSAPKPAAAPKAAANPVQKSTPAPAPFQIPGQKPKAAAAAEPVTPGEKKMSLFYLLQHYNEENAAVYKAQKAAKKEKDEKKPARAEKPAKEKAKPGGFSIPGEAPLPRPAELEAMERQKREKEKAAAMASNARPAPEPAPAPKAAPAVDLTQDETEYLTDAADATVLLDDADVQQQEPYLLRRRNQEKIRITGPTFRIGRDSEINKYVIRDNRHVGHTHCHIVTHDGAYFIVDDNSKNHTSVDGKVIASGEEVQLRNGQRIGVADEEFEFRLY